MINKTNMLILTERGVEGLLHGFKCEVVRGDKGFIVQFKSTIEIDDIILNEDNQNYYYNHIKKTLSEKLNGTIFINETINDLNRQIEKLESIIAKHDETIKMLMKNNDRLKAYESFYELSRGLKNADK